MKYIVKGHFQKTFCATVDAETEEEAIEKAKVDFSYLPMKFNENDIEYTVTTKEAEDLNEKLFYLDLCRQFGTDFNTINDWHHLE